MSYNDIVGTAGVGLILLAYFLNTFKMIAANGTLFFVLNVTGGVLSCYAAVLIIFWPFIILEAIWTVVSVIGLLKAMLAQRI